MRVLGFKNWYENKEKSGHHYPGGVYPTRICDNIFKAPKKMLYIEMDIVTENVNSKNSKNSIDRFYLNNDHSKYSEDDIKSLAKIVKECKSRNNHLYLLSYDFTSSDVKKCFKNSLRSVKAFREAFDFLSDIEIRGMGSIERINESHLKVLPQPLYKQRIELVECHFDSKTINTNIELPFYFNPNDHHVIEKYKTSLKGILVQQILANESFEMKIRASKPWTSSRRIHLDEINKEDQDLQFISEMKYPNPNCSSILFPQNKPIITEQKITIQELTDKRSLSIVKYLSEITVGMPIKFIAEGAGYKEGSPSIEIILSPYF